MQGRNVILLAHAHEGTFGVNGTLFSSETVSLIVRLKFPIP